MQSGDRFYCLGFTDKETEAQLNKLNKLTQLLRHEFAPRADCLNPILWVAVLISLSYSYRLEWRCEGGAMVQKGIRIRFNAILYLNIIVLFQRAIWSFFLTDFCPLIAKAIIEKMKKDQTCPNRICDQPLLQLRNTVFHTLGKLNKWIPIDGLCNSGSSLSFSFIL